MVDCVSVYIELLVNLVESFFFLFFHIVMQETHPRSINASRIAAVPDRLHPVPIISRGAIEYVGVDKRRKADNKSRLYLDPLYAVTRAFQACHLQMSL